MLFDPGVYCLNVLLYVRVNIYGHIWMLPPFNGTSAQHWDRDMLKIHAEDV